jgi:hypothetical protein
MIAKDVKGGTIPAVAGCGRALSQPSRGVNLLTGRNFACTLMDEEPCGRSNRLNDLIDKGRRLHALCTDCLVFMC